MSNSYFKFKQFTINQDRCAMKVCTDACLFGALAAHYGTFAGPNGQTVNCLEIGTGTGLLSLMIAQKSAAIKIDAVEINTEAAVQAAENITASPWAASIQIFNEDILSFSPAKKYDCIISNPPFFEDDLQSADAAKNTAKHNTSLSLLPLLQVVDSLLTADGFFAMLLPYHRVAYFIEASAKMGLHLSKQILVRQTINHTFFRGILFFSRKKVEPTLNEIVIKDAEHNYTAAFTAALRDYYLFL